MADLDFSFLGPGTFITPTMTFYRAALFAPGASTYLPHFAIGQFIFGYGVLSTRGPKVALGEVIFRAHRGNWSGVFVS